MSELPADLTVADRADLGRFELRRGDELLAFADYTVHDDVVVMPHTVTLPAHRGEGNAARVVSFALGEIRRSGRRVDPQCWFVAQYVADHPEFHDLRAG
mgnify:CR=1 FL=1